MTTSSGATPSWRERWQPFLAVLLRAYHRYASWLVSITWKRFAVLSVLLLIGAGILQSLPPFRWSVTETIENAPSTPVPPRVPTPKVPSVKMEKPPRAATHPQGMDINIQIDERGIRITPRERSGASSAASAASDASSSASDGGISINLPASVDRQAVRDAIEAAKDTIRNAVARAREPGASAPSDGNISIALPAGVDRDTVRETMEEARDAMKEAVREQRAAAAELARSVTEDEVVTLPGGRIRRTRHVDWGDFLTQVALLWIVGSAIVKATYKSRIQAEVKAAQATETAEAESLRRQVVEARMAAMQAQVEPHFLFNTLASIDHLIETDPVRASMMQKNLIALLRASMPTMREASDGGVRELAREIAVIRPYLEILKVRMEERLMTAIDVPAGLMSAEFPPMMIQTLVENSIKHGLEPKPEGGSLRVAAEIVHGKLSVSVADTGLGFGRAATAGTGVGLANIRERLQLLYGTRASLTVAENQPSGTVVTVTVPYRSIEGAAA